MSSLFEGLESLGIDHTLAEESGLYPVKESVRSAKSTADKDSQSKSIPLEEHVYIKELSCPSCDKNFYHVAVRQRMMRMIRTDTDLKPYYEPLQPFYYDIMLCSYCGYAAPSTTFNKLTDRQADMIKAGITAQFQPREYGLILTVDEAIERYKMALYNCVVKGAKSGEKAYLCLKLAWLYRDKNDSTNEQLFLQNAFSGFEQAFVNENFPICGLDDITLMYILADVARRLGSNEIALRYVSKIVTDSRTSPRIKDKALMIKESIKEGKPKVHTAAKPAAKKPQKAR